MRHRLEYLLVWCVVQTLRWLPRSLARGVGHLLAMAVYALVPRLRGVGRRNLQLAFPEMSPEEREAILEGTYRSLGRLLAEIPKFPTYTLHNAERIAVYEGFENFAAAESRGKGVVFMTAHLGGWEIGSYVHSLYGHPLRAVMRRLDNPYLDRFTRELRTAHGNGVIDKDEFARGVLAALRKGETVGILMDTNMTPPEGIFVDFFGHKACTASSVARLALRTGAAVVPAFTVWHQDEGRYHIHFEPALEPILTGDDATDVAANTQLYTAWIEEYVRRYPDQWLWIHRRWKTRPPGEGKLY